MEYIQYTHPLDRKYHLPETEDSRNNYMHEEQHIHDSSMTPQELGTTANPFQHQLQALQAKIREGAGKVEFVFFGKGKGSSQQFTPESFGKAEREDMKYLAKINKMKTSTHATPGIQGYSGFNTQTGSFDDQLRQQNLKEINKAIDFAADATTGGAVVVHTGEWQRSISEAFGTGTNKFKEFEGEEKQATIMAVDSLTGKVNAIKKDQIYYEPEFITANDVKDRLSRNSSGHLIDAKGKVLKDDDWLDINNNKISKLDPKGMFERVPKFERETTEFKVKELTFEDMQKRAEELGLAPEVYITKNQFLNESLKAKSQSIFYGRDYDSHERERKNLIKTIENVKKMKEKHIPKERWKDYLIDTGASRSHVFGMPDKMDPEDYFKQQLHRMEDSMRHIHESSAVADAQSTELRKKAEAVQTVEEYALKKTADTFSKAAIRAWQQTKMAKDLEDDVYIAPENYLPQEFGGHPQEMVKIVEASRNSFVDRMRKQHKVSREQATKLAKKHIKSTIDIGHFNLWRQHFERNPGENQEQFDKRFNTWLIGEIKTMSRKGVLGHVHMSDNFGYDDEHLTIGEGNAPIKEFVALMEKEGIKDIVIETGSFNPTTAMHDSWSRLGTKVYGIHTMNPRSFSQVHGQHMGYNAPPFYIVGAYAPSNDFKLWSEVPLE